MKGLASFGGWQRSRIASSLEMGLLVFSAKVRYAYINGNQKPKSCKASMKAIFSGIIRGFDGIRHEGHE